MATNKIKMLSNKKQEELLVKLAKFIHVNRNDRMIFMKNYEINNMNEEEKEILEKLKACNFSVQLEWC